MCARRGVCERGGLCVCRLFVLTLLFALWLRLIQRHSTDPLRAPDSRPIAAAVSLRVVCVCCCRDDLIFLIYLYQRWIYRVDMTRVNEFGFSGQQKEEAEAAAAAGGQGAALTEVSVWVAAEGVCLEKGGCCAGCLTSTLWCGLFLICVCTFVALRRVLPPPWERRRLQAAHAVARQQQQQSRPMAAVKQQPRSQQLQLTAKSQNEAVGVDFSRFCSLCSVFRVHFACQFNTVVCTAAALLLELSLCEKFGAQIIIISAHHTQR